MDLRNFGVLIAVTILSAILIYAISDAIAGKHTDYPNCWEGRTDLGGGPVPVKGYTNGQEITCPAAPPLDTAARSSCTADKGQYFGVTDEKGCVVSYECSYCQRDYDIQEGNRRAVFFYSSLVLGLIFIVAGFLLPRGGMHEWVGLGFIIGGVIGLFIGTVAYWSELARFVRPFVIALELAVVLFIAYKRIGTLGKNADRSTGEAQPPSRKKR